MIALIGLSFIFFGLIQVARLGHESILNAHAARSEADRAALGDQLSARNSYVTDWQNGPDELRYTRDDVPTLATLDGTSASPDSLNVFRNQVQWPLSLSTLAGTPQYGMTGSLPLLLDLDSLASAANLYGGSENRSLEVEPALQLLMFRQVSQLTLTDNAVMPGFRFDNQPSASP